MKNFVVVFLVLFPFVAIAQVVKSYQALDSKQPILFGGDHIIYNGKKILLGTKAFFVDGQLPDSITAKYPYVYNSVNKAAEHLVHGTEASPMVLYLAPWVYWIDDPDDTSVRVPKEGTTPYGIVINCEWLRFEGLTSRAENVVLACNRGQTIGAKGNFTMFRFIGQGTSAENLTFGNYCNVDLVFPLKPLLNRKKRASAIVQAQLIHCNGDKILARNTRFISRLNLCPFTGGKRVLFDRCHFESTDDALCGTAVYLNSTLEFYASKPFYRTTGTGAVFLNCDLKSFAGSQQYFTKAGGQVAVVDSRFINTTNTYWGWQDVTTPETKNYQVNVTENGKPILIGKKDPVSTITLSGKPIENAYRFFYEGKVIYNTYNLLRGDDDWDPMGIKPVVLQAEKSGNKSYTNIPVQLSVTPTGISIETKKNEVELKAAFMRFGNYAFAGDKIVWSVAPKDAKLVLLKPREGGTKCTVVPTNEKDSTVKVVVSAHTASGLEASSVLSVAPAILDAPVFSEMPKIILDGKGALRCDYRLNTRYADQSDIRWYRCGDASGSDPIEVAVSRFDKPLKEYQLSAGDRGYFLMASVTPKHIRSRAGVKVNFMLKQSITENEIKTPANMLFTDFRNISTRNQPRLIPGFWTFDYRKSDNGEQAKGNNAGDAWYYGEGVDGAANMVGLLQGRNGSLYYTPVGTAFGNMKLSMTVAPFKTAGQGFSVAHLYMDLLIKYDTKTKSGYALRFIRTTKFGDAVDCMWMRYEDGKATPISEPVTTSAFKTLCTITLENLNDRLIAHVTTTVPVDTRSNVVNEVNLETSVKKNAFGGFGIEYNGGSPTMIKEVKAEWK